MPPSVKGAKAGPTLDPGAPFNECDATVKDVVVSCEVGGEEDESESDDKDRPAADCNKAGLEKI